VTTAGKSAATPLANAESAQSDAVHVLIKRLDPGLPLPARAHPGDAGTDLFAAADVELAPGQRAVVPTGVAIALPDGYAAFVHPRSGLAARHGVTLVNAPGTVDAGYRGEIRVTLLNTDASSPVRFQRGDRIAQLVVQRVERPVFHEVNTLPGSARGDDGFGSTGGHAATAGQDIGNEVPATS
jgi:dUTP pyrophosphatase